MKANRLDKDIILKDKELIERENRMLLLLSKLEFKEDLKTPTAYVTIVKNAEDWKIRIYYNPKFISKMNYRFVLFHEICHILLWHFNRVGQRNTKMWNIATDLAINSILQSDYEFYIKGSDEGILRKLFFPTYFKLPELRSAEEYYDMILKEEQLQEKFEKFVLFDEHCHSGKDDKSSSSGKDDKLSSDNKESQSDKQSKFEGSDSSSGSESKKSESKSSSSSSSFDDSASSGEVEYDLNESIPADVLEDIRDFVDSLKDSVTKYGKGSYVIKRMLEIERKDRNDKRWKRILERYISDLVEIYEPYLRRNRRLISFPKLFIEDIKLKDAVKLIIALDSSKSISDSDLVKFVTETISILRNDIIQNVEILVFDEGFEVYVSGNVEDVRQALSKFERRRDGGTSFIEICEYYESKDAQLMIVFTDLMGRFPSFRVTKPVIWCCFRDNIRKPPFGYVINLNEE